MNHRAVIFTQYGDPEVLMSSTYLDRTQARFDTGSQRLCA